MDLQLHDKHIVVSGGASGIGAATVAFLRAEGAAVTILDVNRADGEGSYVACDLADPASIAAALKQLPEPIFGLVNCAGLSGESPAEQVLRVNFLGLRELTEAVFPRIERGGGVVNIASGAGAHWAASLDLCLELIATPDFAAGVDWVRAHEMSGARAYDFSKEVAIVYSLSSGLRRFATDRVRMNSVSPGAIETPLLPSFYRSMGVEVLEFMRDAVGGDGAPEDIAAVVAFVLSPRSRWINGADINVSGGGDGAFLTGALTVPAGLPRPGVPDSTNSEV